MVAPGKERHAKDSTKLVRGIINLLDAFGAARTHVDVEFDVDRTRAACTKDPGSALIATAVTFVVILNGLLVSLCNLHAHVHLGSDDLVLEVISLLLE
jgi:hypothetical protein